MNVGSNYSQEYSSQHLDSATYGVYADGEGLVDALEGDGRPTILPKKTFCFAKRGARWVCIRLLALIKQKIHIGQALQTCTLEIALGDMSTRIGLCGRDGQLSTPIFQSGQGCWYRLTK
jgi:hypothetical protein